MAFSKLLYQSFIWRILYYVSVLVLNICIARNFEASASGWFNYVISIGTVVVLISGLGLDSATGYYAAKDNVSLSVIGKFILIWTGFIFFLIFLVFFIGDVLHLFSLKSFLLISIGLFITGNLLINFVQPVFYARSDYTIPGIIALAFNVLLSLFLLLVSFKGYSVTISSFLVIYSGFFLIQGIFLYYFLISGYKLNFKNTVSKKNSNLLFSYGLIAFAGNLIFFIVYRIDYWFVHKYCSDVLLGNYIQVSKLAQVFLVIPSALAAVIFPVTAKEELNIGEKVKMLCRVLNSFFILVLLSLAIAGKWFFPWVFGKSFDKMYEAYLFIIPGIFSLTILSLIAAYFAGKKLNMINLKGAVLALGVMIFSDLLLIPALQIKGAAIASSISYTAYMIYLFLFFSRMEKATIFQMLLITRQDLSLLKKLISNMPR